MMAKNGRATVRQLLVGLTLVALLVGAAFPLHASASESQDISFEIAITSDGDEGGFGKGALSTEQQWRSKTLRATPCLQLHGFQR